MVLFAEFCIHNSGKNQAIQISRKGMGIGKSSINGNEPELETEIGTEMGTNNAPFTDAMFCCMG